MIKSDWQRLQYELVEMFQQAAKEMSPAGREHLGSLAWGRHEWETIPSSNTQDVIRSVGSLEAYTIALIRFLSPNDSRILSNWLNKLHRGELRRIT